MLRFVDAGERDAMRYYLGSRLDGLKKTVSTPPNRSLFFSGGREGKGEGRLEERDKKKLTCALFGFAGVDAENDDRYLAGRNLFEQVQHAGGW